MTRHLIAFTAFIVLASTAHLSAAEPQLAHMVYFTLAEDNAANRETLVAACQKYLGGGVTFFLYFQLFDIAALRFVSLRTKGKAAMLA
ncbi:MAG: hypothetical protein CMJ64_21645, partial [Planctomycetaceae bacterium]|nr:hypothetical protein [Planctomycetaceae bacterium]